MPSVVTGKMMKAAMKHIEIVAKAQQKGLGLQSKHDLYFNGGAGTWL